MYETVNTAASLSCQKSPSALLSLNVIFRSWFLNGSSHHGWEQKMNGEQNTQIERTESNEPLNTIVQRLGLQLELCREYCNEMHRLIIISRQTDI
jgi:hypothetical protein